MAENKIPESGDIPDDKDKFENPTPNPGESEKHFMGRCFGYIKNEHPDWSDSKITAVCHSIFDRKHEAVEFMESLGYEKFEETAQLTVSQETVLDEKMEKTDKSENVYKLIAIVGNRFMNGGFLPTELAAKTHKLWEGTLHDMNHEGTGSGVFGNKTDISKFIGFHKNVEFDEDNKRVTMELVPVKETVGYPTWKGFVELNKQAGKTTNVSVTYWGKRQWVKTSDLPNEADWKGEGFSESDKVPVLTSILPICVSTVLEGKCNAKAGCGIQNTNSKECGSKSCDCDLKKINAEREEQIKRIKEKEKHLTED